MHKNTMQVIGGKEYCSQVRKQEKKKTKANSLSLNSTDILTLLLHYTMALSIAICNVTIAKCIRRDFFPCLQYFTAGFINTCGIFFLSL